MYFSDESFFLWSKIVRSFASFSFCVCHFTQFFWLGLHLIALKFYEFTDPN